MYRLRVTYTYGSTANATSVASSLNSVLAGWTSPVTSARVTQNGATLDLMVVGLTEAQAASLRAALVTSAHSVARTAGKFSVVRTPDVD